jgi:hypothetical protein
MDIEEKNGFQIRTKFSGMDPQMRFRTKLLLIQNTEKKEEHLIGSGFNY